jgi:uncharacterized membrane protein YgcG
MPYVAGGVVRQKRPWSLAALLDLAARFVASLMLFLRTLWDPSAASTYVERGQRRGGGGGGGGGGGTGGGGGGGGGGPSGGGPRYFGMDNIRGSNVGGCSSCKGG